MTDVDHILRAHADDAGTVQPTPDAWTRLVARLDVDDTDAPAVVSLEGHDARRREARRRDARRRDARRRDARRDASRRRGVRRYGDREPRDGRRGEPPRRDRRRPGRWALGLAAAVLAVVALGAVVAVGRSGDPGVEEVRPADGAPPGPTTTSDGAGTGRPDIDEATLPDAMVGLLDHDHDGLVDLVRLDRIAERADVATPGGTGRGLRPPEVTVLLAGEAVAPATIGSVDLGPDGVAYVAVDEEVRAIDVTGGVDRGRVAEGTDPAVSGDGSRLATIVDGHVALRDMASGRTTMIGEDMSDDAEITDLALSPDGSQLAIERSTLTADGTVLATTVTVSSSDQPDGWLEVERWSGAGLPAFMPDGHLALGLGTVGAGASGAEVRADSVGMADLATGEVRWSVGGGGFAISAIDATPDGRWVLAHDDGVTRAFAAVDGWLWDSGTVVQLEGLVDAAW